MKKLLLLLITAALIAVAANAGWEEMPLEEKLVRIEAAEAMPEFAASLRHEPAAVQAVLLNYAEDRELLLKAQAALLSRAELARRILPLYGVEPEFKQVLKAYGDTVLPPIAYFLDNRVRTLELQHYASYKMQQLKSAAERMTRQQAGENTPAAPPAFEELSAEQRGWHAVNFIQAEGHGFLGQFAEDASGEVRWIQTERLTEGATSFFTSGIRSLELKSKTSQEITASDVGWAAVDALIFASAVKILRASKTAAASGRSTALASRVGRATQAVLRSGKFVAPVAVAYLVVRHPGVISDILAQVANILDLPVQLVQILGWMLILMPLLYLASWVLPWLLRPALALLRLGVVCLAWADRRSSHNSTTRRIRSTVSS